MRLLLFLGPGLTLILFLGLDQIIGLALAIGLSLGLGLAQFKNEINAKNIFAHV